MSETEVAVARAQRRARDRYMARLELPEQESGSGWVLLMCISGAIVALVIGFAWS